MRDRLATWLYGEMPKGANPKVEEDVALPEPVPVYMTYFTAAADPQGVDVPARPLWPRRAGDRALLRGDNIAAVSRRQLAGSKHRRGGDRSSAGTRLLRACTAAAMPTPTRKPRVRQTV